MKSGVRSYPQFAVISSVFHHPPRRVFRVHVVKSDRQWASWYTLTPPVNGEMEVLVAPKLEARRQIRKLELAGFERLR